MTADTDPASTHPLLRRPDWLHSVFPAKPLPDILSGMTVALALVPEAVAFAFVAGVDPMIGLYSAFIIGLLTSIFGGRPGMISGATGAMAIVVVALVIQHGEQYLFAAVILCGLIQIAVGLFRLGKLIRIVPFPVMIGFVNGLAIVIGMAQLESFKQDGQYITGSALATMVALVLLTMAIIYFLPKLTKAIPSSLAAILTISLLAIFLLPTLGLSTHSVTDMMGGKAIEGGLPTINFFPAEFFTFAGAWEALGIIWPYAVILAGVGLIESLMTMSLIDEITETRGRGNRECIGQGIANITCGLFGGMGGCAMIGQSLINVNSGGRNRLSGIVAALLLLAFILFLGPWIGMIPMAALVGVMFMVVIGTFEWATLKMFKRMPKADMLTMVTVVLITVFLHNLALAVLVGVIMSALVFAWQHATHIGAEAKLNDTGSKTYQLHGPLFFASVESFKSLFNPQADPDDVIIDFYFTRVYDQSGLEAINAVAEKYRAQGKTLHLVHLSPECAALLDKAGDMVEVNISEDPHYHVATDTWGSGLSCTSNNSKPTDLIRGLVAMSIHSRDNAPMTATTTDRIFNFSAGPCTLPPEVLAQAAEELPNYQGNGMSLIEMSHRSKPVVAVFEEATRGVREVLGVPEDMHILFVGGGATFQFGMIPMNLLAGGKSADYINSGAWAKKAIADAKTVGKVNVLYDGKDHNYTTLPDPSTLKTTDGAAYLHVCSNETIGGLQFDEYPDVPCPIVADMSSEIMSRPIDFSKFGLIYAGAQKNIGPAGVALVLIKQELVEQCPNNLVGYLNYKGHVEGESMLNTPPVFQVYMIKLVMDWLKAKGGIAWAQKQAETRSKILYDAVQRHSGFYKCPVDAMYRSKMNVVFTTPSEELDNKFVKEAEAQGMSGLKGHRSVGGCRASIYNAMPIEGAEALASFMDAFAAKNG